MKLKSTLALTALALASSAAMAQSSATMYGIVDVSFGKITGGKFGLNGGKSATQPNQSYHTPTRFGFRGTEDLGGDLKANFNLETGGLRMVDGGAGANGVDFSREAWVGLSGGFGATRIGRTSSVATQGQARFDLNGISTSSAMDNADISPVTWYGSSRRSAQLQYVSPNFGGVEVGLGYVAAGNNDGQSSTQVRVNYGSGPVALGYVAETKRTAKNRTAQALAGSYDLGVAKLVGGYVVSETEAKGKGAYLGAVGSIGTSTKIGLQHARNTQTDVNATELFASYALSKRTSFYADYVKRSGDNRKSYAIGLLHSF